MTERWPAGNSSGGGPASSRYPTAYKPRNHLYEDEDEDRSFRYQQQQPPEADPEEDQPVEEDDPYANLPPRQQPPRPANSRGDFGGSAFSLTSAGGGPYANGGIRGGGAVAVSSSHANGLNRYSSTELIGQQQDYEQQNEYVNYRDPDVLAARQSAARVMSSRTSSFGISGSRQRIVAYEQDGHDTASQGFGNPAFNGDSEDFYPVRAAAASAVASPYGQYQSHISIGSARAASAATPVAMEAISSPSQVHLHQTQQQQLTVLHTQQQQQQQTTTTTTTTTTAAAVAANGQEVSSNYRNPELPDLIEYLRTGSETTKCHAAAYLQHLTFCEEDVKSRVRTAGGISLLVSLLASSTSGPELQRNVLGALRNLSYGQKQEENKKDMCKVGILQEVRRLLETSQDQEVKELATAVLWNISVSPTLKKDVLDTCLDVLVQRVMLPHAGLEKRGDVFSNVQREIYWTVLFRNASGVVRSVSSCGDYARRRLRGSDGLIESLRQIIQCAVDNSDLDGKAVENCVCTLRNLVYACQEVEDPAYLRRHAAKTTGGTGERSGVGCFGRASARGGKAQPGGTGGTAGGNGGSDPPILQRRLNGPPRGMDLLWQLDIVPLLLPIVADCTNPETLEAAAGALQNLAACDWQPSVDIRAHVRKERGLPLLVDLLSLEADRVVQTAATALRNLSQDARNKDLIGKYALEALTSRLPSADQPTAATTSAETYAAVIATLYTVLKDSAEFSRRFNEIGGVKRLVHAARNPGGRYNQKVSDFAWTLLAALWRIKELQPVYRQAGWTEADFTPPKRSNSGGGGIGGGGGLMGGNKQQQQQQRALMSGPAMSQSGPGARQDSMPKSRMIHRQPHAYENTAYDAEQQQRQQPQSAASKEPTYAKIDRERKAQQRAQLHQQQGQDDAGQGADSWV